MEICVRILMWMKNKKKTNKWNCSSSSIDVFCFAIYIYERNKMCNGMRLKRMCKWPTHHNELWCCRCRLCPIVIVACCRFLAHIRICLFVCLCTAAGDIILWGLGHKITVSLVHIFGYLQWMHILLLFIYWRCVLFILFFRQCHFGLPNYFAFIF